MERYILDESAISQMLELCKSGRARKIARLWYVNQMSIKDIEMHIGYAESVIVSEIKRKTKRIGLNNREKFISVKSQNKIPSQKENLSINLYCKLKNKEPSTIKNTALF